MALWSWFLGLFNADGTLKVDAYCGELAAEVYYKELAIQSCMNLISNTVARSEFITYERGEEVKKNNYYLFNVEPNQNNSSSKFWRDVIHKLVYENECLVIQQNKQFYIADSFTPKNFAFKENVYTNVVIEDYPLTNSFIESGVFHFELHDKKIKDVIEGLYQSYSKLIAASQTQYKRSKSKRGTLEVPTNYPQTEKAQTELETLLSKRFKRYFEAESGAVLPLTNGLKFTELTNGGGTNSTIEGRDIRAFIDDIFDFTAIAFQIPPQLLRGNVADTEKAVNNFLTFCINPLAELITDEINRKLYGKELFLQKTYVKLDTSRIRAVDIKDIASALDILFRIGAHNIDDNLKILGMEPIGGKAGKQRFITKNYSPIEQVMKGEVTDGNAENSNPVGG